MKALLLTLALVASSTACLPLAAAEPGPCPGGGHSCAPPEPCGWAPDPKKDPAGYVEFWTRCLS